MKKLTLIFVLIGCCLRVIAGGKDYLIEINPTKKIIHMEHLGVGENTSILDVLETMPELLGRQTANGSLFSNFSIQVDGRNVGQSRDVVLEQTIVAEVDVIEVSTSPTVSEQKNGTGGVINIKLKPVAKEGVSGMTIMDVSTLWDVQPSVMLNYKSDKFMLRSSVRAEYYRPTDKGYSYVNTPDTVMEAHDTTVSSFKQETAKLYMVYKPTSHDELKVNLWECYARNRDKSTMYTSLMQSEVHGSDHFRKFEFWDQGESHKQSLTAEAFMGYKHTYYSHEGELKLEAQYSYMPQKKDYYDFRTGRPYVGADKENYENAYEQAHQVTGEFSSKHLLYKTESRKIDLKYGMNVSYSFGPYFQEKGVSVATGPFEVDSIDNANRKLYASPYTEMNFRFGKWYLQTGARYQFYRLELHDKRTSKDYVDSHTYTGNVSVRYNVVKDHLLRLNLARNIRREIGIEDIKIYPYYDADLMYIMEWADADNSITMSVGTNYIYAQQKVGYTGTASANAQLIYQYRIFSMAFAGNAYIRTQYGNEHSGNQHWYYNLSLLPVFTFQKQWILSGKLVYNSKMMTFTNEEYGDCFYAQIRVSKQIRGWNIHLEMDDIFDYVTYNTSYSEDGSMYKNLDDLYKRCLKIGFSYTF